MVFMNAGQLDHRNIGSHVTLPYLPGTDSPATVSGALALVIQENGNTEILLAHDDETIVLANTVQVDVNLPPAAAYTLHMKNAVEELLAVIRAGQAG